MYQGKYLVEPFVKKSFQHDPTHSTTKNGTFMATINPHVETFFVEVLFPLANGRYDNKKKRFIAGCCVVRVPLKMYMFY